MIDELNEILKHERKHFNFYLQASMIVKGMERLYLKPFFEKEMAGELEHIKLFGDKIVALGGYPTTESYPIDIDKNSTDILEKAIQMEKEVLEIYHNLYPEAEKYGNRCNDKSIVLLLEKNIEDTTHDMEEMMKFMGYEHMS